MALGSPNHQHLYWTHLLSAFFFFNLVFEFTTKEGSMSETSPKHPQNLQNDISPPTISPVQALGKYNSSTSTFAYPPQVVRQRNHASGLIVKVTIKLKPSMWEIYGNLGSYGLEGIRWAAIVSSSPTNFVGSCEPRKLRDTKVHWLMIGILYFTLSIQGYAVMIPLFSWGLLHSPDNTGG